MNWYDSTKSILTELQAEQLANSLDVNVGLFLTELDENTEDQYITPNMRYSYCVNTYSWMYSACFQAVIDHLEQSKNPIAQCLWKIKAGYNKLINGYFTKFNKIDEDNKVIFIY